jgi:hypothetical protein
MLGDPSTHTGRTPYSRSHTGGTQQQSRELIERRAKISDLAEIQVQSYELVLLYSCRDSPIRDIWLVLLKNAGYREVEEEAQWWDIAATAEDADHRRPDIVCKHPASSQRFVLDVVCWWGASAGHGARGGAKMATKRERWKRRRYRRAMWAKLELGMTADEAVAWAESAAEDPRATAAAMDAAVEAAGHTFVPLGFEANGSWGQQSLDFFGDVVEQAGFNSSAELYHWCAMVFGAHWRQRIGVALARGQAALVSSAVDKGRCHSKEIRGRRGASAEFSTTDCRPCAPLE